MNAPRATGPKRPPRPERTSAPDTTTVPTVPVAPVAGGNGTSGWYGSAPAAVAPATSPADVRQSVADALVREPAPAAEPAAAPDPTPEAPVTTRRGRRGRRVKRVVRRIDLWSVLKLSLLVYTCLYLAVLATLAAVWSILYSSGNIDKLQSFLEDVGLENFTFYGNQMFRACAAIGAVGVIAGTVITVLATALVNVISEMTGGIRLVVIEEEPIR